MTFLWIALAVVVGIIIGAIGIVALLYIFPPNPFG